MICSVVLPNSSMAAQSTFLVAFHAVKHWLLPLRLISFMQLEVLPEGWFCHAEIASLINGSLLYFIVSVSDLLRS